MERLFINGWYVDFVENMRVIESCTQAGDSTADKDEKI